MDHARDLRKFSEYGGHILVRLTYVNDDRPIVIGGKPQLPLKLLTLDRFGVEIVVVVEANFTDRTQHIAFKQSGQLIERRVEAIAGAVRGEGIESGRSEDEPGVRLCQLDDRVRIVDAGTDRDAGAERLARTSDRRVAIVGKLSVS